MTRHVVRRLTGVALVVSLAMLPACGDDTEPEPSDGMSAEEVAALLITADDLGEGWSVMQPEGEDDTFVDGVVTDENRDYLPLIGLCDDADDDAKKAAGAVEWQAFRQLGFDTGMPAPTPDQRVRQAHLVFAQEFLLNDDATAVEDTFDTLAAGIEACAGTTETAPDGERIKTTLLELPELGDDAVGVRMLVTEPGPKKRVAVWDLRNVMVRDGDFLVGVMFTEITTPKIQPQFTDADVEQVVTTALERLP